MALKTLNTANLLKAATKFEAIVKNAGGEEPSFQYDPDKMRKELDAHIAKKVTGIASKYLNSGSVSSMDTRINYQSPSSAIFEVDITYTGNPGAPQTARDQEQKKLEVQIAAELNKLAPVAAKIMGKYQKTPLNYRYLQF